MRGLDAGGTGLRGRGGQETCPSRAQRVGAKVEHKRRVRRSAVSLAALSKHQRALGTR
jgi:hypothetical protein